MKLKKAQKEAAIECAEAFAFGEEKEAKRQADRYMRIATLIHKNRQLIKRDQNAQQQ